MIKAYSENLRELVLKKLTKSGDMEEVINILGYNRMHCIDEAEKAEGRNDLVARKREIKRENKRRGR